MIPIDQSATENKVIHMLIIDFLSHGLRSVKIEQELEKTASVNYYANNKQTSIISVRRDAWVHKTSLSSSVFTKPEK